MWQDQDCDDCACDQPGTSDQAPDSTCLIADEGMAPRLRHMVNDLKNYNACRYWLKAACWTKEDIDKGQELAAKWAPMFDDTKPTEDDR